MNGKKHTAKKIEAGYYSKKEMLAELNQMMRSNSVYKGFIKSISSFCDEVRRKKIGDNGAFIGFFKKYDPDKIERDLIFNILGDDIDSIIYFINSFNEINEMIDDLREDYKKYIGNGNFTKEEVNDAIKNFEFNIDEFDGFIERNFDDVADGADNIEDRSKKFFDFCRKDKKFSDVLNEASKINMNSKKFKKQVMKELEKSEDSLKEYQDFLESLKTKYESENFDNNEIENKSMDNVGYPDDHDDLEDIPLVE